MYQLRWKLEARGIVGQHHSACWTNGLMALAGLGSTQGLEEFFRLN